MIRRIAPLAVTVAAVALSACGGGDDADLTIYSGRNEELVGELIEQFERESDLKVDVRYGDSSELAATIAEEGDNSPADVFFSQDAGALGAVEDTLSSMPRPVLDAVPDRYRDARGRWAGVSGRARVIAYNRERTERTELPRSVLDLDSPRYRGKVGWAPTNASFESFVTALRKTEGERAAGRWLEGMVGNDTQVYENNIAIRDAVASGEIDYGLINHYYVAEARAEEGPDYPVALYEPPGGDPGALVNVAGAAVLESSDHPKEAERFVRFLLSDESQRYFAEETKEYPLTGGAEADPSLRPLREIEQPDVDLSDLDDLEGTVELLERTGAL